MKIVAGKFKGKKLIDRQMEHIRPTADMVKQSIFNKLQFKLAGAKVLDLFCGTGALGIEALSRGAGEVVFADLDRRSIKLTQDNLKLLSNPTNTRVLCSGYQETITKLKGEKFDIIFLDPPYASDMMYDSLKLISEHDITANGASIICESEKLLINAAYEIAETLHLS